MAICYLKSTEFKECIGFLKEVIIKKIKNNTKSLLLLLVFAGIGVFVYNQGPENNIYKLIYKNSKGKKESTFAIFLIFSYLKSL